MTRLNFLNFRLLRRPKSHTAVAPTTSLSSSPSKEERSSSWAIKKVKNEAWTLILIRTVCPFIKSRSKWNSGTRSDQGCHWLFFLRVHLQGASGRLSEALKKVWEVRRKLTFLLFSINPMDAKFGDQSSIELVPIHLLGHGPPGVGDFNQMMN